MSDWSFVLGEVLLNACWIGTALWLAVWAGNRLLSATPGFRGGLCLAALAASASLPALQRIEWPEPTPAYSPLEPLPIALSDFEPSVTPATMQDDWRVPAGPVAEALVRLWLLGAACGLAYLVFGVFTALRLKAKAHTAQREWAERAERWRSLATPRARLLLSTDIDAPVAVGWLRPAVLFPETLAKALDEQELERLWLHEAAHLERRDDWQILLEKLCLALLWFHPAAWALARRVAAEREMACDDLAADRAGSRTDYARTLTRLAGLRLSRGVAPALSIAGESNLSRRIEMLLRDSPGSSRLGRSGLAFAAALCGSAICAVLAVGPLIGLAQVAPPAPAVPAVPAAPAAPPSPPSVPSPASPRSPLAPPAPTVPIAQAAPKPAPAPQPKPAPAPAPKPSPRAQVDPIDVETQAEIRALSEETRKMSEEIRVQVEKDLGPMRQQLNALREQMQVEQAPFVKKMSELAEQMAKLQVEQPLTEAQQRELEAHGRAMEAQSQALEKAMEALAQKMEAVHERAKPDEAKLREMERKMEERAAEMERRIEERAERRRQQRTQP
ncbi:MAG: M56 family metallopeptidase [Bryobacterales bacterium]